MKLVATDGALVRLLMNAIPAIIFLVLSKRFNMSSAERSFWKYVSFISIFMVGLLLTTDFSTALDRMALYFIPLQLVVFSHLPNVLAGNGRAWNILIISYYALILTVWLNFAKHAKYWLPYTMGLE